MESEAQTEEIYACDNPCPWKRYLRALSCLLSGENLLYCLLLAIHPIPTYLTQDNIWRVKFTVIEGTRSLINTRICIELLY